ncbi:MAG: hypothetical protein ACM31D_14405 [Bacteroidota bacterium]
MNEIRWLDSMSVGLAEFDDDHRRIIAALGQIAIALDRGEHDTAVGLAEQVVAVATDHIRREGVFLRQVEFPGADDVIGVQQRNLGNLAALVAQLRNNPADAGAVAQNMAREFIAYLLRADINYKSYVEHAGLSDC